MATQEDKIREMANKKLLNGEQKKVLYKLFEQKINDRLQKTKTGFANAEKKLEDQIEADAKKNPAIIKLLNKVKQAKIDQDNARKELGKAGFNLSYNDEHLNVNYDNPAINKLRKEREKVVNKQEELKLKLLADIHGLPMTYAEMTDYINGELTKIENE